MKLMRFDKKAKEIVYDFDNAKGICTANEKTISICFALARGATIKEICEEYQIYQCQARSIKEKFFGKGILIK